jgi:hypothetical protein
MIAISIGMLDCAEYLMVRLAKKSGQLTKHIARIKQANTSAYSGTCGFVYYPRGWANETTGPALQLSMRWGEA